MQLYRYFVKVILAVVAQQQVQLAFVAAKKYGRFEPAAVNVEVSGFVRMQRNQVQQKAAVRRKLWESGGRLLEI